MLKLMPNSSRRTRQEQYRMLIRHLRTKAYEKLTITSYQDQEVLEARLAHNGIVRDVKDKETK